MNEEPVDDVTPEEPSSPTREAFKDLADAAKKACEAGKADAKKAVDNAIPVFKKEVEKGVHDIAFGVGARPPDEATPLLGLSSPATEVDHPDTGRIQVADGKIEVHPILPDPWFFNSLEPERHFAARRMG